ncbi:MAG: GntR family transcriptional regulator [Chloroflexi bacterium]|nr:GntR family transcriptional regulator [Chloroflexota bacterium]
MADAIRESILKGDFKRGVALKQDELAAKAGVSKIPVREALVKLEAEGLVQFSPNRGAVVVDLSVDEVQEITLMRIALETVLLREAIPYLKMPEYSLAAGLLNGIANEPDAFEWVKLDWAFHEALYKAANLPKILKMARQLYNNMARYMVEFRLIATGLNSQRQHRAILRASRRKNVGPASSFLENHILDTGKAIIGAMK